IDGLDEVGNPAARRSLRDAVHEGMRRHPECRWLLTSRIVGYDEVPFSLPRPELEGRPILFRMLRAYYLAPFDATRAEEFADKWYVCRAASDAVARSRATDLCDAIFRDPGTTSTARIPFLLTLMATVHRNNVTLPNGRARLYKLITDAYVEKREESK